MSAPADRRYLESHEWHKLDGDVVTIGLSQFAVDELTDVTYLDITAEPGPVQAGQSLGEIESVKATSEIYFGVTGELIQVNQDLIDNPALINEDPYDKGWICKVRVSDTSQLDKLMDAESYDKSTGQ